MTSGGRYRTEEIEEAQSGGPGAYLDMQARIFAHIDEYQAKKARGEAP